jgi:hypothetical protein
MLITPPKPNYNNQNILQHFGIADSGATSIFFTTDAVAVGHNKNPACQPLQVKILDGNYL